jgi:uncharacterized protein
MPFPSVRRVPSIGTVVAAPVIALIRLYQLVVSPMRPPTCRFYPSCSAYALTAIERFGIARGSWLATRRLLRCHPWNPGGVDHVPHPDPAHTSGRCTRQT